MCFETIEHLPEPLKVLKLFRQSLDGLLIISTPNEEKYPFDRDAFAKDHYPHLRHYTADEFEHLLNEGGFVVKSTHCQTPKEVVTGTDGKFLIFVCE